MILKNKLFKILLILFLIICIIGICTISNADFPEKIDATSSTQSTSAESIAKIILGVFQVVGYVLAIVMATWMGIKYIMASPDGKAEIKGQALAFFIGALLLFSASTIVGWLKDSITSVSI